MEATITPTARSGSVGSGPTALAAEDQHEAEEALARTDTGAPPRVPERRPPPVPAARYIPGAGVFFRASERARPPSHAGTGRFWDRFFAA